MAKANPAQTSLNGGEISPLLLGREDLTKYASSLYVCKNAVVLAQGGWTRRGGTAFLTQTKYHDKTSRLFPFQYSILQNYILEFGEGYIRFFTDHGILTQTSQAISAVTKAAPGVVTYVGSDTYANGDRVYISGCVGMTQLNGREFKVAGVNAGANTFQLLDSSDATVDTTNYDTYLADGIISEIIEVSTSFTEAQLPDIRVVQSADVLYILHPDVAPQTLTRVSATSWTLATVSFQDGPYDVTNRTTTTLASSGTTGSVTLTASAVTGINSNTGFQTTDVGRLVRFKSGATWGYATITARTSTTVVTATVTNAFAGTAASTSWRLGIWSNTTGFPVAGTFFEDRLVLGGADDFPQRWDASNSSDYNNFAPTDTSGTVTNAHSIGFTLNSSDVNGIKWIKDNEKGLLIGTSRGEWLAKASSLGEALTPTNVTAKPSTRHGSEPVEPVQAGKVVLFVQRAARKLRELTYVFEVDGFKAPDMTLLAEHITDPSIYELAYQEQPQNVVWAIRSDGVLLGFTYERDQDVTAWHRHELGGQSDADAMFIPIIESIACVPHPDGTRDEVYMVVQRYINGGVKRYIELMSDTWHDGMSQEDAFHVDSGFTQISPDDRFFAGVTPASPDATDGVPYELGMKFTPVVNGSVTDIRYYKAASEGAGTHVGKIWTDAGVLLTTVAFTSESSSGWQQQALPVALAVTAGTTYVVSVNAVDHFALTTAYFTSAQTSYNGNITAPVTAGVLNTSAGSFPSSSFNNSNYFRDIVFVGPNDQVTGLWHLEGETIGVYADGAVHPEQTVTNGKISLNYNASIVTSGYYFQSDGATLPISANVPTGSGQAMIKRIERVGFWLLDTLGVQYGPSFDNLTEILVRNWGDNNGEATPLFSGVYRGRFEGDYDRLGQVYWRCEGPFPATILTVNPQVDTSEET